MSTSGHHTVAERYRSWVLERVDGVPPLADVGVEIVDDIAAHQRRKLWLLNGPHSALAYGGLLAGHATIAGATADPVVATFVRRLVDDVLEVAEDLGPAAPGFAAASLERFRNPALRHTCAQVGADGSRKLPQRILPVMAARRRQGRSTHRHATVVAAWLAAVTATPIRGRALSTVDDPAAVDLQRALSEHGAARAAERAVGRDHVEAVPEITAAFDEVTRFGVRALEERR